MPDPSFTWMMRLETFPRTLQLDSLLYSWGLVSAQEPDPVLIKAGLISPHGPPVGDVQNWFFSTRLHIWHCWHYPQALCSVLPPRTNGLLLCLHPALWLHRDPPRPNTPSPKKLRGLLWWIDRGMLFPRVTRWKGPCQLSSHFAQETLLFC